MAKWEDPSLAEVRRIKDEYAAQFNYDIRAIFEDLKRQERESGRTYVSFPPRRIAPTEAVPAAVETPEEELCRLRAAYVARFGDDIEAAARHLRELAATEPTPDATAEVDGRPPAGNSPSLVEEVPHPAVEV